MRLFVAGLASETNTFATRPTTLADFEAAGIRRGAASTADPGLVSIMIAGVRGVAEADGHEVIEGLFAVASPGGIVDASTYASLRDELLDGLSATGSIDAMVLLLHGAMVADGIDDCEGDLLERVRARVGPRVAITVALDPHCHCTRRMAANADALVAFKEYPHTDTGDRAADACRVALATAAGRVRPVTHVVDCAMVGLWHTTEEPMRSFVGRMKAIEREPGVLSVSFGHGFPWGDVPEAGAKVWVTTDDDASQAEALARSLARELWDLRASGVPPRVTVAEAMARASSHRARRPLVLADAADNPGGAAAGDSTFLLDALLHSPLADTALGGLVDPDAVAGCLAAGPGATVWLDLGGRHPPTSGEPLRVEARVIACRHDHRQTAFGASLPMGDAARIRIDGRIDVLLVGRREQVIGLDAFTGLGIDPSRCTAIVVKSAQHFRAAFAPIAGDVLYVETPGLLCSDFARLPYRRRDLDYWPRVAEPRRVRTS